METLIMGGNGDRKRRVKRNRTMVPIGSTENIRIRLEMTESAFSIAIGYSEAAYRKFKDRGEISKTGHMAAEALVRRQAPSGLAADEVLILRIVKGAPSVTHATDLQTMRLAGVDYLLVPAKP